MRHLRKDTFCQFITVLFYLFFRLLHPRKRQKPTGGKKELFKSPLKAWNLGKAAPDSIWSGLQSVKERSVIVDQLLGEECVTKRKS